MNTSITLGQRIQAGRKAAHLSQEALGEQLQVSRQAVSKWESDATIPELENLIAMSRIFGVSVGQLLGVESEPAPQEEAETDAPPAELTERELEAVERIAEKYAEALSAHQKPKWSRRRKIVTGIVCGGLLLYGGLLLVHQFNALGNRLDDLQFRVNSFQSDITQISSDVYNQISSALEQENAILSNHSYELTDVDTKAKTVTLTLRATPKEWTATTTAVFYVHLNDGQEFSFPGEYQNGTFVAADVLLPMDPYVDVSVVFSDGEEHRTGRMETIRDCDPENFILAPIHIFWGSSWSTMNPGVVQLDPFSMYMYLPSVEPESLDLCLYRNNETTPEQVLPVTFEVLYPDIDIADASYPAEFKLEDGETMAACLRATDADGNVTYTLINQFQCAGNYIESLDPDCAPGEWIPGTIIK